MLDPVYQALLEGLHAKLDGIDEGSAQEAGLTAPVSKTQVKADAAKLAQAAASSQSEYIKEGLSIFMGLAKAAVAAAK